MIIDDNKNKNNNNNKHNENNNENKKRKTITMSEGIEKNKVIVGVAGGSSINGCDHDHDDHDGGERCHSRSTTLATLVTLDRSSIGNISKKRIAIDSNIENNKSDKGNSSIIDTEISEFGSDEFFNNDAINKTHLMYKNKVNNMAGRYHENDGSKRDTSGGGNGDGNGNENAMTTSHDDNNSDMRVRSDTTNAMYNYNTTINDNKKSTKFRRTTNNKKRHIGKNDHEAKVNVVNVVNYNVEKQQQQSQQLENNSAQNEAQHKKEEK